VALWGWSLSRAGVDGAWHGSAAGSDPLLMALAERYGTPLYVYDGPAITDAFRCLSAALHPAMEVLHPLSPNPNTSIVGLLASNGASAGVSSLVELRAATVAGVCPSNTIFLGPGNSRAELDACVAAGVYAVVVGSWEELAELAEIAAARSVRQRVLLRVNLPATDRPGVDEAQVLAAELLIGRYPMLDIAGVHGYVGQRVLDPGMVVANTARSLELADRVAAATGIQLDAVVVGSGLRAAYFDGEADPDLKGLAAGMSQVVEAFHVRHPRAQLLFDAGAFITAPGTTYIARVRYVRESSGDQIAVIDGTTPRLFANNNVHSASETIPVRLVGRPDDGPIGRWRIVGPLGAPADGTLVQVALPRLRPGDLLGFMRCGGDGRAASYDGFLAHALPAEVLVDGAESYLIRSRDEPSDVLRKQRSHHLPTVHPHRTQILEQIRMAIAVRLGREASVISEQTTLTELGLDNTRALEVLIDLEQHAQFEVDADQLDAAVFLTVGSLIDYVVMSYRGHR
jgi:diaminopimelate decarboxylase